MKKQIEKYQTPLLISGSIIILLAGFFLGWGFKNLINNTLVYDYRAKQYPVETKEINAPASKGMSPDRYSNDPFITIVKPTENNNSESQSE